MNQRGYLHLKLQSTVEGLSLAAITYYIVGFVSYLAKGLTAWGWPLSAETNAAIAIPFAALRSAYGGRYGACIRGFWRRAQVSDAAG